MRAHVRSIGVLAPGLTGWDAARAVLRGERPLERVPIAPPAPRCLPAAERRRSSPTARLAIAVAEEAIDGSGIPAAQMEMVFAAAEAAGEITHQLCEVLAGTREVSPTVFHNSVHNAPLGYLSIATGARLSGTSICRGRWTFAAGFVAAALQAQSSRRPVLFVCYDSVLPPPLQATCAMVDPTAIAMVLTPESMPGTIASAQLSIETVASPPEWPAWIPPAWHANPSARGLASLGALATPGGLASVPFCDGQHLEIRC
ncbi:beta-ketoacyl synthase chain length factor [Usitatibacter palustris]|uniref:Beta-ketoacyl synthase-like N-terminal domain-containing protein n=1 Tax=Usitatibacter palustris TaxID=2732487 RepID=A0A6M4H7Y0_9PROT|nr:beta-ketoacyl synthase chain length factor [Usitatibacter palustris]QJR15726.1 hypothetical protein DSM104440_02552 [Usitatibacter palustris]